MSVLDLLRSHAAKRILLWVSFLAALLCVVTLIGLGRLKGDSWGSIGITAGLQLSGGLLGGILTAAYLIFLSRYLLRNDDRPSEITILPPDEGHQQILAAVEVSRSWLHSGHVGRWVTQVVLQKYRNLAREDGALRSVGLILIDPDDEKLLREYSEYAALVRNVDLDSDPLFETRSDIMATLIRAGMAQQHFRGVEVEVYMRRDLDFSRVDIAESMAFQTLPGPNAQIMVFRKVADSGGDYLIGASRSYHAVTQLVRRVNLSALLPLVDPSEEQVLAFMATAGIACATPDLVKESLVRARSREGSEYY